MREDTHLWPSEPRLSETFRESLHDREQASRLKGAMEVLWRGGLWLPKGRSLWEGGSKSSLLHVPAQPRSLRPAPLPHVLACPSPDGSAPLARLSKGVGTLPSAPGLTENTYCPDAAQAWQLATCS